MAGSDYSSLMKLWDTYMQGLEDHHCSYSADEFISCEVCERSQDASYKLQSRVDVILKLLENYHDRLDDLSHKVIQHTECPRSAELQESLLLAIALLDKSSS